MGSIGDRPSMAADRPADPLECRRGCRQASDKLTRGRMIVALDALLSKRNVTLAARQLDMQTPALSRLLGQMREEFGDPLFVRSGRGLVPTPFAEALRPKVQALAAAIDDLFQPTVANLQSEPFDPGWNVPSSVPVPPLATRPANLLDGQPSPAEVASNLDRVGQSSSPHDRLARNIGILGIAGGGHGRPLTMEEAEEAMGIVLAGEADPIQTGALFGMMRVRGATAPELAGFVRAMQGHVAARFGGRLDGRLGSQPGSEPASRLEADLDWPCFTSPNYHNPPWFFHAAKLVAEAGYRVLLHGNTGSGPAAGRYEVVAAALGIPVCSTADDIGAALATQRIAYVPLTALAPQIHRLIGLHRLTQFRNAALEAVHLLRPAGGRTSLLGVTKPYYRELHRDTARLLGLPHISVLGSLRDVAQYAPFRPATIHRLIDGEPNDLALPARMAEPPATPRPRGTSLEYWQGVWAGGMRDARAERIIVGTAAFALYSLPGAAEDFNAALCLAEELWKHRCCR
ncbi:glycosyl transferase family protein (plasmid) [Azospirillum ramasamyi]|uniref:Glycosyl transferase family protein n=1 Tax=Azospirillum ramasamyi TaxID=682998 RepID=A0A2U9SCN8_9PROT|nr:glycosyl transferase family protein [Azospirillum ramasamyi]